MNDIYADRHKGGTTVEERDLGYERYEFVRTLTPREFRSFWEASMKGARFDDLIDIAIKLRKAR